MSRAPTHEASPPATVGATLTPSADARMAISDASLVDAARHGEAWAFEALYKRHVQRAFALAVRLTGQRDAAWDVVQDAFVTAFEKLKKLREPAAFAGWLRSTVVRTMLMAKRREKARRHNDHVVELEGIASSDATAEERLAFVRALRWLSGVREPDKTIYLLRVIEGCENQEIAELTGVSLATVKRKIARVEEHLQTLGKGPGHES